MRLSSFSAACPIHSNTNNPFSGHNPVGIISADFNGDSIPDLAVVNQNDNSVTILLGDARATLPLQRRDLRVMECFQPALIRAR